RLYCIVVGRSSAVKWTLPDGSTLSSSSPAANVNYSVSDESLLIRYVWKENDGVYQCQMDDAAAQMRSRLIRLTVHVPDIAIFTQVLGSQVTVSWNRSRIFTDTENFRILYRESSIVDGSSWSVRAGLSWHTYVFDLKPLTNYTFCLAYVRGLDD